MENFTEFERLIGPARRLLVVDCEPAAMIARVSERGKSSGRADDQSLETIKTRIQVYESQTADVISNFTLTDKPKSVDSNALRVGIKVEGNRHPDEVQVDFKKAFLRLLDL